jgi:creatinine amidohydrolase
LQWLGNSHHHLDFQGTLSAPPRVYLDLLGGLIDNLVHHGFQRIVLINGHGGNDIPGKQSVFEAKQRYRSRHELDFVFATYWGLGTGPWEHAAQFEQTEMGHACEWETSMMLRLRPELVGDYRAAQPVSFALRYSPASLAWTTLERSQTGHIGSPHLASAEKGELLFQRFSADIVRFLNEMVSN